MIDSNGGRYRIRTCDFHRVNELATCIYNNFHGAGRKAKSLEMLLRRVKTSRTVHELCMRGAGGAPEDSSLSPHQSYRYLQQARHLKQSLPVSDTKVAFTVKVSRKLVRQVRTRAREAGLSLSEFVSRALLALLTRRRERG